MKRNITIGTKVKSHYRSRWKGIVLAFTSRGLPICLILLDKNGHKMRKRTIKVLSKAYLTPVNFYADIPKDWDSLEDFKSLT